jgi:SAM-dependent methyltransferase
MTDRRLTSRQSTSYQSTSYQSTSYRSPVDGGPLHPDGEHALAGRCRRWPVVDGIPYLRIGRDDLADAALAHLDAGQPDQALALLLADQDDWWTGPTAEPQALSRLIAGRDTLSLREAMALLQWGRVGDYFAHRWTDPTFLAGLALVEAHWAAPATAFELACGIGHHLRALAQHGVAVTGGDVVFAKLWVARHWVVPQATLVCFDAAAPWPMADQRFDLVACHDAFYFLEPKPEILRRLRALSGGQTLIGHVHNRDWPNLSAGAAMTAAELAALAPDGVLYDDDALTRSLLEQRAPAPAAPDRLREVEAFALAIGAGEARPIGGRLGLPPGGGTLRRNPLYDVDGAVAWPSERYRTEYAARATYPMRSTLPPGVQSDDAPADSIRCRELVDLPVRW